MTNKKVTRRALLMSVTSLLICISMLLGTTFAWFTDEVTSGVNKIVAGNLDVELTHKTSGMNAEAEVKADTTLFQMPFGNTDTLWEPGAMAYETFNIKNVGSLALKYQFNLSDIVYNTVIWGDSTTEYNLTQVIKFGIIPSGTNVTREAIAAAATSTLSDLISSDAVTAKSGTLLPEASESFTVALYWQPDNDNNVTDNRYNLKNGVKSTENPNGYTLTNPANVDATQLYIDSKVTLLATQQPYESDSFDNQYDAGADGTSAWTGVPVANIASTAPITAAPTTDLNITKSGDIESATVPAAAANEVFNRMADTTTAGASNELTMNLNVTKTGETTAATGTTVDLEIDMTAVMKTTVGDSTTTKSEGISSLDAYVTINYNLGKGKNVTGATHKGNPMVNSTDTNDDTTGNGIYSYDATTGILTIKTKTLSPFAVTFANTGRTATITQPERTWMKGGKYVLPANVATHSGASAYTTTAVSEDEFNTYYNKAQAFVTEMEEYFTPNESDRTITISSVDGLKRLYMVDEYCSAKNAVACKNMTGSAAGTWYYATLHEPEREFIVKVANDLDLGGSIDANGNIVNNWTPTECSLDIDFDGHKVSNLVSDTYVADCCGLFYSCSEINNLVLENVTILGLTGNKETGAGAISGAARGDLIDCTVRNAKITTSKWAGAFAAFSYGSIKNCKVENVEITCGYKIGGLCGQSSTAGDGHSGLKYTGNKLTNVKIVCDLTLSGKKEANIGKLMGYLQNDATISGNTFENMTVTPTNTAHDGLVGVIGDGYTVAWSN